MQPVKVPQSQLGQSRVRPTLPLAPRAKALRPLRAGRPERGNSIRLLAFLAERDKEFIRGNSGLLENAAKSADLDLAVVRNDAPGGAPTQNDVTAALAQHHEAKPLQRADGLRT